MDRRTFLKLGGVAASARPLSSAAKRANIILIMADDMGFSDIGCFGSEIATPNLDKLAAGGMRLTSFYHTARCSPPPAPLLTRLYPPQAGVRPIVVGRGPPADPGAFNHHCVHP